MSSLSFLSVSWNASTQKLTSHRAPHLAGISSFHLTSHARPTETLREVPWNNTDGRATARLQTQALGSVTWQAVALKSEVTGLVAGAPVQAGWRGAGHVDALAAVPRVARLALAPVGAGQVDTGATMLAQSWRGALVHVYLTLLTSVASQAGARELISRHSACTSVGTRLRCAGINPLAFLSFRNKTD